MSDVMAPEKPRTATRAQRGHLLKFLPLPVIPHHAEWFEAGPVSFAVEARVLDDAQGGFGERSASVHVFSADRAEEYLRFDCFERFPHYHYILNAPQQNIVWGYDPGANGPMLPWALAAIRDRLPTLLRGAGEGELADRVAQRGFDASVLEKIEQAVAEWTPKLSADGLMEEARAWYARWKEIHPQFNTAD